MSSFQDLIQFATCRKSESPVIMYKEDHKEFEGFIAYHSTGASTKWFPTGSFHFYNTGSLVANQDFSDDGLLNSLAHNDQGSMFPVLRFKVGVKKYKNLMVFARVRQGCNRNQLKELVEYMTIALNLKAIEDHDNSAEKLVTKNILRIYPETTDYCYKEEETETGYSVVFPKQKPILDILGDITQLFA